MPMPRCIFRTVLCVLTSLDPDFTYLSAMPSQGTAGNVIWTWSTKLVTSAQRTLHSRQTYLHSTGRDCFRLHRNHFLPFSFFLLHLSTTFCSGWWRSSWYVGVIHRNADRKIIFLSSNGVFDNFCAFCKVESPVFGFLDKKPSRKCKLVHTKVLLILC